MEAADRLFQSMYLNFILRDFAGKMVPGTLVFLGLSPLSPTLTAMAQKLTNETPLFWLPFLGGVAWLAGFFLQSIASSLGRGMQREEYAWRGLSFFRKWTAKDEQVHAERIATNEKYWADKVTFFRAASSQSQALYERYVVIKEATWNTRNAVALLMAVYLGRYIGVCFEKGRLIAITDESTILTGFGLVALFALHRQGRSARAHQGDLMRAELLLPPVQGLKVAAGKKSG